MEHIVGGHASKRSCRDDDASAGLLDDRPYHAAQINVLALFDVERFCGGTSDLLHVALVLGE